ncbi:UNVERIFIED_ORG: hypothetical protein ABID33_000894 [Xanthobacter viscosus]|uniref:Uncharacterized protein n=1 Tax=Xanthobacter autotrophicus TaxID=280 RepID=A0A6C1KV52_XANAU|nr:hypothetical protein [Xanthobacter autotrophicus]TLX43153.1 hypothetical protein FBQ73_10965 [Xanthobacter autotrophicus]
MFDRSAGPFAVCHAHNGMPFPHAKNIEALANAVKFARYHHMRCAEGGGMSPALALIDGSGNMAPLGEFDGQFLD